MMTARGDSPNVMHICRRRIHTHHFNNIAGDIAI